MHVCMYVCMYVLVESLPPSQRSSQGPAASTGAAPATLALECPRLALQVIRGSFEGFGGLGDFWGCRVWACLGFAVRVSGHEMKQGSFWGVPLRAPLEVVLEVCFRVPFESSA